MKNEFVDVILPLGIGALTYSVPERLRGAVVVGSGVRAPVGESRVYTGVIIATGVGKPSFECRDIIDVSERPIAGKGEIALWRWMADYYMAPLGDVFRAAVPTAVRKKVFASDKTTKHIAVDANERSVLSAALPLTAVQQAAYDSIISTFTTKNTILLHGVTSSGKTEIYIHLILKTLAEGGQALYLLPEIALTVQIRERLRRVFGNRMCVYHSKTTDAERAEIWRRQMSDSPYDVVLGARSAVLLPFSRLGLVIVDEEHDTSFKQQDPAPRYNGRNVAIVMAHMTEAKTLLGTATPSAETWYNALTGKYGFVRLATRHGEMQLPEVRVVDIADLARRKMMRGPFSPDFLAAISEALTDGRQAILFQNRRGFAPMTECRDCGWVPRCLACDVPLTYHKKQRLMTCHYCGSTYAVPAECPDCGSRRLAVRGLGTERIEETMAQLFPKARIVRMDLDTTRSQTAHERIIGDFAAGNTDILIGTQMITKGLDFDRVSVVGILNADAMLNMPDFRAYEQAYALMSQVAGRAGRKGRRGLVILQTRNPQSPVIAQLTAGDDRAFYDEMLRERRDFGYPPYCRLVYVFVRHKETAVVDAAAAAMGAALRHIFADRVLGPDKPIVSRVRAMSIRKLVIKIENGASLSRARRYMLEAAATVTAMPAYRSVIVHFDVDPL